MEGSSKKSRGVTGKNFAQMVPHRVNGYAPDWQAQRAGAYNQMPQMHGGSTTMRGFVGGYLVMRVMGIQINVRNTKFEAMFMQARLRCTHVILREF